MNAGSGTKLSQRSLYSSLSSIHQKGKKKKAVTLNNALVEAVKLLLLLNLDPQIRVLQILSDMGNVHEAPYRCTEVRWRCPGEVPVPVFELDLTSHFHQFYLKEQLIDVGMQRTFPYQVSLSLQGNLSICCDNNK